MANSFGSVLQNLLGSLFAGGSSDTAIGIDIGTSSLKVVQLRKSGSRLVLDTYGEISLGSLVGKEIGETIAFDPEILTNALSEIMEEANVTSTRAVVSIQAASSLIVVMRIPYIESDSKKELDEVIGIEARKYIPVPMNQVAMDWWMVPSLDAGITEEDGELQKHSEVLVVAIRNSMMERYDTLLSPLSFTNSSYEIEIFGAIRSTFRHELSSVVLVDLGASITRVAIVNYGVVRVFHIIRKGAYHITQNLQTSLELDFKEAEEIKKQIGLSASPGSEYEHVSNQIREDLAAIFTEVRRAVLSYEKEYDKVVGKIIVSGGGARTLGLETFLEDFLNVQTEIANPFLKVDTPKYLDKALSESGPSFAVALGLAMRPFQ